MLGAPHTPQTPVLPRPRAEACSRRTPEGRWVSQQFPELWITQTSAANSISFPSCRRLLSSLLFSLVVLLKIITSFIFYVLLVVWWVSAPSVSSSAACLASHGWSTPCGLQLSSCSLLSPASRRAAADPSPTDNDAFLQFWGLGTALNSQPCVLRSPRPPRRPTLRVSFPCPASPYQRPSGATAESAVNIHKEHNIPAGQLGPPAFRPSTGGVPHLDGTLTDSPVSFHPAIPRE